MTGRVAFLAMPEEGHFTRLRPLISDLGERGLEVHVFTHRRFADRVERAGGRFVDLFQKYPIGRADAESLPVPCRYVSFAGCYAEEVLHELRELAPSLVVYDTFAVIGRVVGALLGVPYVNVCAGHNMDPVRFVARLRDDPRVDISPSCHRAVGLLRERYGLRDASPFSYVTGLSPFLNVYCEPPAFLTETERRAFEPVAFYGSLPPLQELAEPGRNGPSYFPGDGDRLKVYVSFGTVVWRYWLREALAALTCISEALGRMRDVTAVISLGRADLPAGSAQALERSNVSVAAYVDQRQLLRQADVFVTHQGLNSTHEAIFAGVPMISYPFFSDQPALAEKCRQLGVAVPLERSPDAALREQDVEAALARLSQRGESLRARLAEAREWELAVMASRGAVVERIAGLMR